MHHKIIDQLRASASSHSPSSGIYSGEGNYTHPSTKAPVLNSMVTTSATVTEEEKRALYFSRLPVELLLIIAKNTEQPTTRRFARCTLFPASFKEFDTLETFLTNVANGKPKEVAEQLNVDPGLLLEKATVKNYALQTIEEATALQIAWGADDHQMCQMLLTYFAKLPNGLAEAKRQIDEKFPNTLLEMNEVYDFSPIVEAITTNRNFKSEIEKFKNHFAPGTIKMGKHFNVQIVIDALTVLKENDQNWDEEQSSLFIIHVIGYLQRLYPACLAQQNCFDSSIHRSSTTFKPFEQRFLHLADKCSYFFPLDANQKSRLGEHFALFYSSSRNKTGRTLLGIQPTTVLYVGDMVQNIEKLTNYKNGKKEIFSAMYSGIVSQLAAPCIAPPRI